MSRRLTPRVSPHRVLVLVLCFLPLVIAVVAKAAGQASWWPLAIVGSGYLVGAPVWIRLTRRVRGRSYVPPSNLPPPPTRIVGREEASEQLKSYLLGVGAGPRVAKISGVAGIGKTAFALFVAHRVADSFTGGELFAHIDPDSSLDDAVTLVRRRFIQALSPLGAPIPDGEWAQSRLYRKLTRRMSQHNRLLVVFDDVTDASMVELLLPHTPWCAVIITSRWPLEQVSGENFKLVELTEDAALRMLGAIISTKRISAEPVAARDIVRAAACHPLAIQLVGMALATRPHSLLSVALQRMTESAGPRPGTVDNALDLSFAMLTRGEQRALTMLGLIGQRQFYAWELATLLQTSETEAWRFCERLTNAGLIQRRSIDAAGVQVFRLLEHVESYARQRANVLPDDEKQSATAHLNERRRQRKDEQSHSRGLFDQVQVTMEKGTISRAFKDARDAIALARESRDATGEAEATAMLAELLAELGGLADVRDLLRLPLQSVSELPRIRALRIAAKLHRRLRQVDLARANLDDALSRNTKQRDVVEQIRLLREYAIVESVGRKPEEGVGRIADARMRCDDEPALEAGVAYAEGRVLLAIKRPDLANAALRLGAAAARREGQTLWAAWITYQQARAAFHQHEYPAALATSLGALEDFTGMRHRYGNAHCRQLIGQILLARGDTDGALRFLGEALETFHNCGDSWVEAKAAEQLAAVQLQLGVKTEAILLLESAGRIYTSIEAQDDLARIDSELTRIRRLGGRRSALRVAGGPL